MESRLRFFAKILVAAISLLVIPTVWNSSLHNIFPFGSTLGLSIGLVITSALSLFSIYSWHRNVKLPAFITVLALVKMLVLPGCYGSCLGMFARQFNPALGLAIFAGLLEWSWKNREEALSILTDKKLRYPILLGIANFIVFLSLNIVIRDSSMFSNILSTTLFVFNSTGLIITAFLPSALYLKEKLKAPILAFFAYLGLWMYFLYSESYELPISVFYMNSTLLPNPDYATASYTLVAVMLLLIPLERTLRKIMQND